MKYLSVKVYLEGIEVPTEGVVVESGTSSSAFVQLTKVNYHVAKFKAGTLCEIYVWHDNDWRLLFFGKLGGISFNKTSCQIRFYSIFNEIEKAYYAPVDLTNTYFGHLTPVLYVSNADQVERGKGEETQVLLNSGSNLEYFSFSNLEAKGNVPDTIMGFLDAAAKVNPAYKIQHDLLKLKNAYFILDNPNIFPVAKIISMGSLIKNALSQFNFKLSYWDIITVLLQQLRYKVVKLSTPVKIDKVWKWVLILPDYSWLPPISSIEIEDESLLNYTLQDDFSKKITRSKINFYSTESTIDLVTQKTFRFLYTYPPENHVIDEDKGGAYMKFTEEEKISGVNAVNIVLDDKETFYSLIDWTKGNDPLRKTDYTVLASPKETGDYFGQIAKSTYLKYKGTEFGNSNFSAVFDPSFRGIFPVKLQHESVKNFVFNIGSVTYSLNTSGVEMVVFPSFVYNKDEIGNDISLNWDPVDYKNAQQFYSRFDFNELITEKSFRGGYAGSFKDDAPLYHKSAHINAQHVANGGDVVGSLGSIFCYERAKPIADFIETATGKKVNLPVVSKQMPEGTAIKSLGGMKFENKSVTKTLDDNMVATKTFDRTSKDTSSYPSKGEGTPANKGLTKEHKYLIPYTNYIEHATKLYGIGNSNYLRALIIIESKGQLAPPNNPVSNAAGLFQMIPSTLVAYGVTEQEIESDAKLAVDKGAQVFRDCLNSSKNSDISWKVKDAASMFFAGTSGWVKHKDYPDRYSRKEVDIYVSWFEYLVEQLNVDNQSPSEVDANTWPPGKEPANIKKVYP